MKKHNESFYIRILTANLFGLSDNDDEQMHRGPCGIIVARILAEWSVVSYKESASQLTVQCTAFEE